MGKVTAKKVLAGIDLSLAATDLVFGIVDHYLEIKEKGSFDPTDVEKAKTLLDETKLPDWDDIPPAEGV